MLPLIACTWPQSSTDAIAKISTAKTKSLLMRIVMAAPLVEILVTECQDLQTGFANGPKAIQGRHP
jgi:hypothetical protein